MYGLRADQYAKSATRKVELLRFATRCEVTIKCSIKTEIKIKWLADKIGQRVKVEGCWKDEKKL